MKIDNHADTTCLGENFTPLSFTGEVCGVSLFTDEYDSIKDVRVCSGATAWDDANTGLTYILIFHQSLWFGSKMKHSLICPNQCRVTGLSLCDDPFDPNRDLGIEISERGIIIPFKTHGTIVRFKTRTPTQNKIENQKRKKSGKRALPT